MEGRTDRRTPEKGDKKSSLERELNNYLLLLIWECRNLTNYRKLEESL